MMIKKIKIWLIVFLILGAAKSPINAQKYYTFNNEVINIEDTSYIKSIKTKEIRIQDSLLSDFFNEKGDELSRKGKYDYALFYCRLGFKYSVNEVQKSLSLLNMAGVETTILNFKEAEPHYRQSLQNTEKLNDDIVASIRLHFARALSLTGNFDSALTYFSLSLNHYLKNGDKCNIAQIYSDIGLTYLYMEMPKKAEEYLKYSFYNSLISDSCTETYTTCLINLSNLYLQVEKLDSSILIAEVAHNIYINNDDEISAAFCLNNIGVAYYLKGDKYKAIKYISESKNLKEKNKDKKALLSSYQNLSELYNEIGNKDSSEFYIQKLKEITSYSEEAEPHFYLSKYKSAKTNGDYKTALNNFEKYWSIIDTIRQKSLNSQVAEISEELNVTLKEYKIKELESQKIAQELKTLRLKNRYTFYIGTSIITVILIVTIFTIYILRQRNIKIKNLYVHAVEINRARMNPHFIFNSLTSIRYFVQDNNTSHAENYLMKLSELMRMILVQSGQNVISLEEELTTLQLYLDLEKERLENSFSYHINIDPTVNTKETAFPSLILQPFAENAVKHVFSVKNEGRLELNITKEKKYIRIEIIDNGEGFDKNKKSEKSMGLMLTQKIISNYAAMNDSDSHFKITSSENGTVISFNIPEKPLKKN